MEGRAEFLGADGAFFRPQAAVIKKRIKSPSGIKTFECLLKFNGHPNT